MAEDYKAIVQKIIDLLKANTNLSEPSSIRKWYFGIPVKPIGYPFGYVQWNGRNPASGRHSFGRFHYDLSFEIGISDRSVNEDDAEKSVYDKIGYVEDVLNSNPTLGGLVESEPQPREITIQHISLQDYAVAVARIFHHTRKWIP